MKKIVLAIILLNVTPLLFAQSNKLFGSIGVGSSIPISEFSDNYKIGFNIAGNVGLNFHSMIGVRADLQYSSFSYNDHASYWGDITGDPYSLLTISVDGLIAKFANLRKNQGIIPYGIFGAGLYFGSPGDIKLGRLGTVSGKSETYLGIGIGGGAILKFSKNIGLLAEAKYSTTLAGTQLNYLPLRLALVFTQ